ncbi:hypothetical protein MXB_4921 [Myxobolus squamalis]|nr:hypothetical protein MXB_4921 [Myxobolus squamalis]
MDCIVDQDTQCYKKTPWVETLTPMKVAALQLWFWKLLANSYKQSLFEVACYVLWLSGVMGLNNYLVQHL